MILTLQDGGSLLGQTISRPHMQAVLNISFHIDRGPTRVVVLILYLAIARL